MGLGGQWLCSQELENDHSFVLKYNLFYFWDYKYVFIHSLPSIQTFPYSPHCSLSKAWLLVSLYFLLCSGFPADLFVIFWWVAGPSGAAAMDTLMTAFKIMSLHLFSHNCMHSWFRHEERGGRDPAIPAGDGESREWLLSELDPQTCICHCSPLLLYCENVDWALVPVEKWRPDRH